MKKTWLTEIAVVLMAVGGGLFAASEVPDLSIRVVMYMKVFGIGLGSVGGSLLGYRGSKKLNEIKDWTSPS